MKRHDKLVRDNIPEIIRKDGKTPHTRQVTDEDERRELLGTKMVEEAHEYLEDPTLEELADMSEVLKALIELSGYTVEEVEKARQKKRHNRGGFEGFIFLEGEE